MNLLIIHLVSFPEFFSVTIFPRITLQGYKDIKRCVEDRGADVELMYCHL